MSRQERIDALIQEAKELIEEIASEGHDVVKEAESTAQANVNRYGALKAELSGLKDQVQGATRRMEQLPTEFARATLEDDFDKEVSLKEEYRRLQEQRAEAEAKMPEVEAELRSIEGPNRPIHELSVWQEQFRRVNKAAATPLADINRIGNEIQNAATRAAGYFEQVIEDRRSESWGWQNEIDWSDAGRAAIRNGGNIPGESRVKTIRRDDRSLAEKGATL